MVKQVDRSGKATWKNDYRAQLYVQLRRQGKTQTQARDREHGAGISRSWASVIDSQLGFSTRAKDRSRPDATPHEATPHDSLQDVRLDHDIETDRAAALPNAADREPVPPDPESGDDGFTFDEITDTPSAAQVILDQPLGSPIDWDEVMRRSGDPRGDPSAHRYANGTPLDLQKEGVETSDLPGRADVRSGVYDAPSGAMLVERREPDPWQARLERARSERAARRSRYSVWS